MIYARISACALARSGDLQCQLHIYFALLLSAQHLFFTGPTSWGKLARLIIPACNPQAFHLDSHHQQDRHEYQSLICNQNCRLCCAFYNISEPPIMPQTHGLSHQSGKEGTVSMAHVLPQDKRACDQALKHIQLPHQLLILQYRQVHACLCRLKCGRFCLMLHSVPLRMV